VLGTGSIWKNLRGCLLLLGASGRHLRLALALAMDYHAEVLTPSKTASLEVPVGQAILLNFTCESSGLADATLSLHGGIGPDDDLQFFVARDRRDGAPHDPLTWPIAPTQSGDREKRVTARGVRPWGGVLGVANPSDATKPVSPVVTVECNYIVAFDGLFWGNKYAKKVCPAGEAVSSSDPPLVCSGQGKCASLGICECNEGFQGPACATSTQGSGDDDDDNPSAKDGKHFDTMAAFATFVLCLIVALMCAFCYKTCQKLYVRNADAYGEDGEEEPLAILGGRFQSLVQGSGGGGTFEGLTPLSRSNSLLSFGMAGADTRAEDRYLRRGGFADDGI